MVPVSGANGERVQAALDAAIGGDVEPLVALFAPDMEWRGVGRGHLWWRHAPS
jgi:ketosteroid isomerase-like protein